MKKNMLVMMVLACSLMLACSDDDKDTLCGNGVMDEGEQCDTNDFGDASCQMLGKVGNLTCTSKCELDTTSCKAIVCNHNGIKEDGESCDGEDFGGETCASVNAQKPYGQLGCTDQCTISTHYCAANDLGLQAPYADVEQTDALCSDGQNNFNTVDKNGNISSWFDCKNDACRHSPIVQVCQTQENTNASCSDNIDNPTTSNMQSVFANKTNGLTDCQDPSCYKNWRVTVCNDVAPQWELGDDCKDGSDNDGDTLIDCNDPDCLHAGSPCSLDGRARVLFDNAHHQIAGTIDWIVDVTGRHPYPSKPANENDWHGSLSMLGKDLLDSGNYIIETLPQDRSFTYKDQTKPQDLSQYQILVSVEPSVKYKAEEIQAIHDFVKEGGALLLFADHKGADRDANNVDAIDAINDMLSKLPGATAKESNPFGFYALESSDMKNETASPAPSAIATLVKDISKTDSFAGTAFEIIDTSKVSPIMITDNTKLNYAVAVQYEKGRIVAVGDSSISGDGTNYLGITLSKAGYKQHDNRIFLLNVFEWLRTGK